MADEDQPQARGGIILDTPFNATIVMSAILTRLFEKNIFNADDMALVYERVAEETQRINAAQRGVAAASDKA